MSLDPKWQARPGTREEIEEYQRRMGGGGDQEPPSLAQKLKRAFDEATWPTRKAANAVLRPMLEEQKDWAGRTIDRISSGGLDGWYAARWVLRRYGPSQA